MNIVESCKRTLGSSGESNLTINKFPHLTIVSGISGGGKNTLLAGIALHTNKGDNHVICTECWANDCGVLQKVAKYHSQVIGGYIEGIIEIINESPVENIFIEQYQNCGNVNQPTKDMKLLSDLAKLLNKNITICVHRPRQSGE
jgi:ABC-type lipoprotein export system ATPase subunit